MTPSSFLPSSVSVIVRGLLCAIALVALPACSGGDGDTALPSSDLSQAQVQQAIQGIDTLVPELMARSGVPGVAVAIVWRGQPLYLRGFGVRKTGDDAVVDADTVFQLASVSKSVGATVVATQVDRGVIGWESPVAQFLPEFRLSGTAQPDIGDLYAHRSGLHDHAGDQLEDIGYGRDEILQRLRHAPVRPLGSAYAYTNFGMTAAGQAVANAAGTDWATLSEHALYRPLGMTQTSSRFADFMARSNRAVPHVLVDGRYQALFQRQPDAQSPAGGVSASVRDMAKWLALIQGVGTTAQGNVIVSRAALEPALSRQSPPGGNYGFGFGVGSDPANRPLQSHSGAFLLGAATVYMNWPASSLGIVVLTNAQPLGLPEAIAISLIEYAHLGAPSQDWYAAMHAQFQRDLYQPFGALAGQTAPASPQPPLPLAQYAGRYANDYYGTATIALEDNALVLTMGPTGQVRHPLQHWDGSRFVFDMTSGENAIPGSRSAVDFDTLGGSNAARLQIEYYAEDLSGGVFTRVAN